MVIDYMKILSFCYVFNVSDYNIHVQIMAKYLRFVRSLSYRIVVDFHSLSNNHSVSIKNVAVQMSQSKCRNQNVADKNVA